MPVAWTIDGKRVRLGDDWEATSTAKGRYEQLTATVSRDEVRHAHQESHISGRVGGHEVWAGQLDATPAISRLPVVKLTATGPVARLRRTRNNRLYQSRDYGAWQPRNSEPYNKAADDTISADSQGGRLLFRVTNGTDITSGDLNGLIAWFPGENINRVAFDWTLRAGTTVWALRLYTGNGPTGALTQRGGDMANGGSASGSIDQVITADDDMVALAWVRTGATTTTTQTAALKITNLRVNGRAIGDDMAPGDVIADMASSLGLDVSPRKERTSGQNALPFYWEGGSWGDAFDELSALDDWPWLAGRGRIEYGPWDHRWVLRFSQENEDLDFPPVYNRVRVFYTTMAGAPRSIAADASPDPLGKTGVRNEYQYDLGQSYADDTIPTAVAGAILEKVSHQRVMGTVTIGALPSKTVWVEGAGRGHALLDKDAPYKIQPGELARLGPYPRLGAQRIVGARYTLSDVTLEFGEDAESSASRALAQIALRQARGHRRSHRHRR